MTRGSATFFSYARDDSEFALRLAQDLRDRGVDVWLDQLDIPAGAAWDRAIEDAIETCGRMLIVLSPRSVESENVMDEVSYALDQGDRVVPVLFETCDVPLRLRRLQYVDFTQGYDRGLKRLAKALAASGEPTAVSEPERSREAAPARASSPQPPSTSATSANAETKTSSKTKWLIGGAIVLALALLFGLTSRSKPRTNHRQTPTGGSNMVAVPSVLGVAKDRAVAALERQRLRGEAVDTIETCKKPAGTVASQNPAGMTQAKTGSTVQLVIAHRTAVPLPERSRDITVLAPGAGHAVPGRDQRRNRIEFMLAGDPCAAGTVGVTHPTVGREIYELRTGEKANRNIVYGAGKIVIQFDSLNPGARLVVRTD